MIQVQYHPMNLPYLSLAKWSGFERRKNFVKGYIEPTPCDPMGKSIRTNGLRASPNLLWQFPEAESQSIRSH